MDLIKLREDEDPVVQIVGNWSRLRQLIALDYLNTSLKISRFDVKTEIVKEFKKENGMRNLSIALAAALLMAGCAQMFTAKTKVSVETLPDGSCRAEYSSDKEQQGLQGTICNGTIHVDKAGTLESVVAATLQNQAALLGAVLNALQTAGKIAATTGS